MEKIVVLIKPFDSHQKIYVYKNDEQIEVSLSTISNLNDSIFAISDKYNIQKVDLVGPSQYLKGLRKSMKKAEIVKYEHNNLEINII